MGLLTSKQLTKKFGAKTALNNFDLAIPEGSIYGLLGPNGAGKTTFLRIVNQITAPDSGEVFLKNEKLSAKHIPMVGYMPEERGLYKNMKVGEQAMYFAQIKGLSATDAKKQAKYWFDKLEIGDWWNKKLNELSKGMGQKVQFVITVIHSPKLLIFDEPFSGFDPVNARLIGEEILELRDKGTTIIFSTHRMESVEEMCDHVALINHANKVLDGPVEEVRNQFKKGRYIAKFHPESLTSLPSELNTAELLEHKNQANGLEIKLKLKAGQSPNSSLQELMNHGSIQRFEEDVPSMNEIFLRAVKN